MPTTKPFGGRLPSIKKKTVGAIMANHHPRQQSGSKKSARTRFMPSINDACSKWQAQKQQAKQDIVAVAPVDWIRRDTNSSAACTRDEDKSVVTEGSISTNDDDDIYYDNHSDEKASAGVNVTTSNTDKDTPAT